MAYLGNTLINGSLRCLNKAYFNDLSIGSDVEIAGKTTTNQLVVSGGDVSNLVATNSSTGNISVIIGNPISKHIAMDVDDIQSKANATSANALYINYGGGRIYLSNGTKIYADNGVFKADSLGTSNSRIPNAYITTLDATTGNITTLKTADVTADNVTVNNVLKSSKWDISNVANLANDFMVAPTIKISSSGTVNIASLNDIAKTCTLTFSDATQINSDEFGGCKWYKNSKVRVTFTVNGTLNSNIEGIVKNNMNTNAGSLAIDVTLDNITGLANGTYNATDATIMLYEIASGSNLYPVGIRMTAYGTNNSSYIDMYGGTASTDYTHPIVRIGRLNGITFNGKTFGTNELPAAWGIYTLNGYFEGAVVAKEGKIGEWIIDSKKIYTGTWGSNNSAMMSPGTTSTDGNKSIGGSDSISGWTFTSGANFGVNKDGSLYANKGKIGKWVIETDRLHIGNLGDTTSVVLSTGITSTTDIGGSGTRTSENALTWVFTAGNKLGVTNNGVLYANDVNVTGAVNATALHVGSSSSANHLIYENSTIDLQTDWLKFDSGVVTIGQDNNSQIFLDGQSIDLKDENGLTYFYVGDKRINGVYTFTMEHPYMVTNNYSSNSIGVDYVINSNYPVTVYDEENNEIPIDRIHSTQIVSDSYKFLKGKVYKILFTTSSPVYNFSYVQKPDFIGSNAVVFARRGKSYGTNSFTEGIDTTASGRASHAEGEDTTASGSRSHAEGEDTTASGNYGSHAEGNNTIASGDWGSHAEGNNTTASSLSSHAEGDGTTASGWYSHAEGFYTTASGNYGSHAEGYSTVASGKGSHASGQATYATRDYQTVIGRYNSVTTSTDSEGNTVYDAGNYVFVIGNGDTSTRSNALTVDWNGKVNNVDLYCISTEGIKVTHDYQTAIGKYNEIRTSVNETGDGFIFDSGNYAFIIGNGTSDNSRSNALTVDWNGQVRSCNPNISADEYYYPNSDTWFTHYSLVDSNNYTYGRIQSVFTPGNEIGLSIQLNREISDSYFQNNLNLFINSQGVSRVSLSSPQAWRDALGFEKKVLINGQAVWNGTKITVYSCGNIVTLVYWGSENGNWGAGAVNAYYTLPVGYRPYVNTQQIFTDQNNKRIIVTANTNGQVGIYWLLDAISSKTNVYGSMTWIAYQ